MEPQIVFDCIDMLRKNNDFVMPSGDIEWFDFDHQDINISRSHILQDALREVHKRRFDPTKLLNVIMMHNI